MPATTADPITAVEYLELPPIEGKRTELIDGELFVMNQPLFQHQDAVLAIAAALRSWCRADAGRGVAVLNIDTAIDEYTVLAPDVQWYAEGRITDRMARPQPLGDLVVEVRSPSTWHRDLNVKRAKYEQHAARELWLVDLAAPSVIVLRRSAADAPHFDVTFEAAGGDTLTTPLLDGFALDVAEIFVS